MNTVAARACAHQQQDVARISRSGGGQGVFPNQPDTHGINQWVLGIGIVEINLTGHVGHADAISVPGNSGNNSVK